ncbi:MAG: hypothetical protein ACXV5H_09970 [Halobacteriota archaeon]
MSAEREPKETVEEMIYALVHSFDRAEDGCFDCPDGRVVYWGRSDAGLFSYSILEWQREDINVNNVRWDELPAALREAIELQREETVQKEKDRAAAKAINKTLRTVEAVDPALNDHIQRLIYDYRHLIRHGRVQIDGKTWTWFIEYNELFMKATISYQEGEHGEFIYDVYPEVVPARLIRVILDRLEKRLKELGIRNPEAHETIEKAMHDQVIGQDTPVMRLARKRRWAKA